MTKAAPPRTPNAMWLPDHKKLRVDTSEESPVFKALQRGGCKLSADDLSVILDLSNHLTEALRFYVSETAFAVSPSEFRQQVQAVRKSLTDFVAIYPPAGGHIEAAISEYLGRMKAQGLYDGSIGQNERELYESAPYFLEQTRQRLELLNDVLTNITTGDSGRGRDGNRALAKLINSLLLIYFDFTGKRPGIGTTSPVDENYLNPAESFVEAAIHPLNGVLPPGDQISRSVVQYRVRRWCEINSP